MVIFAEPEVLLGLGGAVVFLLDLSIRMRMRMRLGGLNWGTRGQPAAEASCSANRLEP